MWVICEFLVICGYLVIGGGSIWLRRNAIIFNGESFNFDDFMSKIVGNTWMWLNSNCKIINSCNFHTWNILPLLCFRT